MPPTNARKRNQKTKLPFSSSLSRFSCFISHLECLKLKYKSYKEFPALLRVKDTSLSQDEGLPPMVSTTKFGTISNSTAGP